MYYNHFTSLQFVTIIWHHFWVIIIWHHLNGLQTFDITSICYDNFISAESVIIKMHIHVDITRLLYHLRKPSKEHPWKSSMGAFHQNQTSMQYNYNNENNSGVNPNTSKYHTILHGILLVPPGVKVFRWQNGPRLICLAKYTEPYMLDTGGVVGSWSPRVSQVRGSNPGGGGGVRSLFGWILAAGKKKSEKFWVGC